MQVHGAAVGREDIEHHLSRGRAEDKGRDKPAPSLVLKMNETAWRSRSLGPHDNGAQSPRIDSLHSGRTSAY